MCQSPEREENEPGKENPMFIVLRKEVGNPEGAVRHFFKERGGAIPFIQNGEIDTIFEDEKADQERRRKDQQWFDEGGDRSWAASISINVACRKRKKKAANLPAEGIEPTRSCDHWIGSDAPLRPPHFAALLFVAALRVLGADNSQTAIEVYFSLDCASARSCANRRAQAKPPVYIFTPTSGDIKRRLDCTNSRQHRARLHYYS